MAMSYGLADDCSLTASTGGGVGRRSRLTAVVLSVNFLFFAACLYVVLLERSLRGNAQVEVQETALQLQRMQGLLEANELVVAKLTMQEEMTRRQLTDDCVPVPHWEDWRILDLTSGCEEFGSDCMQTANFPNDYPVLSSCAIEFASDIQSLVTFVAFDTERNYDWFKIGDESYSGATAPKAFMPVGGSMVHWTSDDVVPASGWRMCLRQSCANMTCPEGWSHRSDALYIPCANITCDDSDTAVCCEKGCRVPQEVVGNGTSSVYSLPDSCMPDEVTTVKDCPVSCAGGEALDGFDMPQVCNQSSGLFQLPDCEAGLTPSVQSWRFPWEIDGSCQTYGTGCVSSNGVGGRYDNNELCLIRAGELQDRSEFQIWLTYLDSEQDHDHIITNLNDRRVPPQPTYSSQYLSGPWLPQESEPIGPLPVQTLMWTTDSTLGGTGFIICAQARCSTMSCPAGYRFNCDAKMQWCARHDCNRHEDVASCCLPETQDFLNEYTLGVGEAANVSWCERLTTTTTTTTTTTRLLLPDFVGQLILELSEDLNASVARLPGEVLHQDAIKEGSEGDFDLVIAVLEALQRLASVSSDNVLAVWTFLGSNSSQLDIVFRVEGSLADLAELSDEDVLAELNSNETYFADVLLRTVLKFTAKLDGRGYRSYGSGCLDLYGCSTQSDCWREDWMRTTCGKLHEEEWCSSEPGVQGPGWCNHFSGNCPTYFPMFLDLSRDWSMGTESVDEVCCTCGGGKCAAGTFWRFPTVWPRMCVACLPGTSSSPEDDTHCFSCPAGRYSDELAASECKICAAGQFTSEEGQTKCDECEPGHVAPDSGSSECIECWPGTFSHVGIECHSCAMGTYADMNGTSECKACPPGQYMPELGATECWTCDEGTFTGTPGRTLCDPCATGQFAPGIGMSACMDCPRGEEQSEMGSIACDPCDVGKYAQQEGLSLCIECPPGMEALDTGASSCDRCLPGSFKGDGDMNCSLCGAGDYATEPGLTACRQCPAGEYASEPEGATHCLQCGTGVFSATEGMTACQKCALGSFNAEFASTACVDCDIGTFANVTGLSTCSLCSPGLFMSAIGASACEKCSAGREAPDFGATECDTCRAGTFGDVVGLPKCLDCIAGMFSPLPGSTACLVCQQGRFGATPARSECAFCEPGTYASQVGMTHCTGCNETLPGLAEYWTTMSPPRVEDEANGIVAWTELRGAVNASSCGCRPGTQPAGSGCQPCGEGLRCLGMDVLRIEEGYAWDGELSVWDCSLGVEKACPGGIPGACKAGRDETSVACALCMDKMVPVTDGSCVKCKDADYLIPTFVAIVMVSVAVGCYCVFDSASRKRPKLSFLLIIASTGQFVTIVQQLGVVSLIRVNYSGPLLNAFTIISAVTFFDIQVLRPSCVFMMDVVTMYTIRIGAVFISLAIVCFAHLVSQLAQHRKTWRTRWPSLCCALGTIVLTFFVSILSTMLGPLQCRKHPNERQTVAWYPSVACWEEGDHVKMIIIGSFSCLVPFLFLVACFSAVQRFPRSLLNANTDFLNKWAFLFFRYNSEAYWYGPIMLMRNALVSVCPVLVSPVLQILALETIILFSLILLLVVMPWRVRMANYLDAFGHVCLLMVTMIASFFVDDRQTDFISVIGVAFICAIPSIVLAFLGYGVMSMCQTLKRPYQFFLCHHKLGAGCFCRLLKMWLLRSVRRKVFIDSDDLKNLDSLFDVVAHETETLLAINSQNLLQRPWCVGEITTAHRSRVKIAPVYMPGVEPPTQEFIENFLLYVPDISCLTQFSIDLAMIQDSLTELASLDYQELPEELHDNALDAFCEQVLTGKPSGPGHRSSQTKTSQAEVVIICNKKDYEAASSALILAALFNPMVQHKDNALATVLGLDEYIPSCVKKAMLICSNGVFTTKVMDALFACEEFGAVVLPIMNVTNFIFPSVEWMEEQSVFQSMKNPDKERAIVLVQAIFLEIAVDFQPSALSGTEATLKIKVNEIAGRLFGNMQKLSDAVLVRSRGSSKDVGSTASTARAISYRGSLCSSNGGCSSRCTDVRSDIPELRRVIVKWEDDI